jgi:hypothetical protein
MDAAEFAVAQRVNFATPRESVRRGVFQIAMGKPAAQMDAIMEDFVVLLAKSMGRLV